MIAEALAAALDPGELAELVRIDDEAALELNRLKDDLRTQLIGLARRSQASSAYLTRPAGPPADARSA